VKDPNEDTQLAFYAAMIDEDSLRAAYVNVGEKSSGTHTVEQKQIVEARDTLVQGIQDDFMRIERGVALRPLGEGGVCDYCSARGLCRKDFWGDDALPAAGGVIGEGAMP
jgi:ATP-dependent helicase/nuclease subunit B